MRRAITLISEAEPRKWLACAFVLLVPGSLILVPLAWLIRQWLAARA